MSQLEFQILDDSDFAKEVQLLSARLGFTVGGFEPHKCLIKIAKEGINLLHPKFKKPFTIQWPLYNHEDIKQHHLIKACGLHKNAWSVVDATGGWGEDAMKIAHRARSTLIIEKNPLVYCLLNDALNRLESPQKQTINLIHTDTMKWLEAPTFSPDVIYIDPMFPKRTKSALVKKNMQILQSIVGSPSNPLDLESLCRAALKVAVKRVVVKRPYNGASIIQKPAPTFQIGGRLCRFDVYGLT